MIEKTRDNEELGLDDPKKLWNYLRQNLKDTNESMSFILFPGKRSLPFLSSKGGGLWGYAGSK